MTLQALLSLLLLLPFSAPQEALTHASAPARQEVSGEDLSEALEEVRANADVPGLVALALQDGEIAVWGATGVRAEGRPDPMRIHDPIHLGSCSKAMTATLTARLIEEGVLEWETTIGSALPEFAKGIDEGFHGVTVEQLLQHRGGIAERRRPEISAMHEVLEGMTGSAPEVRRNILARVLESPPLVPEEGVFDYSNFGYMTVGTILEELTGKTWAELMREKLFLPLELTSAGTGSPPAKDHPVGHLREDDAWSPLPPGPGGVLPDAMGPAGLVHMSLLDWGKFVGEHLAGARGEDGFVSAASIQRMHRDPGTGYAAGWALSRLVWSWGEGAVITHNGSDGTWHSVVYALPEWDLAIVAATNASGAQGSQATDGAQELLLQALGLRD